MRQLNDVRRAMARQVSESDHRTYRIAMEVRAIEQAIDLGPITATTQSHICERASVVRLLARRLGELSTQLEAEAAKLDLMAQLGGPAQIDDYDGRTPASGERLRSTGMDGGAPATTLSARG